MTSPDYTDALVSKGKPYSQNKVVSYSYYNTPIDTSSGRIAGNSRVWGDATPEVQVQVINILVNTARQFGLNDHETAYVVAMARVESGFNPDAAAGPTSAHGLGQFVNGTGADYGLTNANRWDVNEQAIALVRHFYDNQRIAQKRGVGEEYIYKYHHDGANSDSEVGLDLAKKRVLPLVEKYESLIKNIPTDTLAEAISAVPVAKRSANWWEAPGLWESPELDRLAKKFIQCGMSAGDTINGFEKAITKKIQAITDLLRDTSTYRIVYYDPLVLDLNGDGIETVASNGMAGALFDLNNDGIRTATGWISSSDGILVRDVNGNGTIDNGTEVFGDSTALANGSTANNGFAALSDMDSNGDGVVNAADANFAQLQVWRDLNQNGVSDAGELFTLQSLGIQSLNTTITSTPNAALAGGVQAQTSSFTRTDGTTSTVADINLTQDTWHSRYIDQITVPTALQHLPNISGMGRLRDLQQAAVLSPALATALEQYTAATSIQRKALLDNILIEWINIDSPQLICIKAAPLADNYFLNNEILRMAA